MVDNLRKGDRDVLGLLCDRYSQRLATCAARHLQGAPTAARDHNDVVNSVLMSIWERAQAGRLGSVTNRNELWQLLACVSMQKAIDQRRTEGRQKRDAARTVYAGSLSRDLDEDSEKTLFEFLDTEPGPAEVAEMRENIQNLLSCLPDDATRRIAVGKLHGKTNEDLAAELGFVTRTIERKLDLIRGLWIDHMNQS
jgi:DNA-directed RNA polymerase specialized sigma24 family protein